MGLNVDFQVNWWHFVNIDFKTAKASRTMIFIMSVSFKSFQMVENMFVGMQNYSKIQGSPKNCCLLLHIFNDSDTTNDGNLVMFPRHQLESLLMILHFRSIVTELRAFEVQICAKAVNRGF